MTLERLLNLLHNEYYSFIPPPKIYTPPKKKQISGYAPGTGGRALALLLACTAITGGLAEVGSGLHSLSA